MHMKYLVMGAGRMAAGVVFDLLRYGKANEIILTDIDIKALAAIAKRFADKRIRTHQIAADQTEEIGRLMHYADAALSAVNAARNE